MKYYTTLLMAVFTVLSASVFSQQDAGTHPRILIHGPADLIFTCPLHPKVISKIPGRCSQCNMNLGVAVATSLFTCPSHPTVTSELPVKCSDCGMDLELTTKEKINAMKKYACLMHTDVTSNKPGACVKCKLALKENKTS